MNTKKTLYCADRQEWRQWLAAHFETENEVLFVFPTRASGEQGVSNGYEESNLLGFCRLFFINISLKSLAMRQHSFVFCLI